MINTYFESNLHKSLKAMYSEKFNGKAEQKIHGKICDILTATNTIIEIQTGNLGKLKDKIKHLLPNHQIHIVYPLPIKKKIETYSTEGKLLSSRRSPKKQNIFYLFREITAIYPFFNERNFTLEVLETEITEIRTRTDVPVQLQNKSRRFCKNWYKTDKKLDKIISSHVISSMDDLVSLLPKNLPEIFCTQDLKILGAEENANYVIWVLKKAKKIVFIEKKGNTNYYKKTASCKSKMPFQN